ncbi:YjiH family protein [Salinisphaera sp. USBA-960]|uniref:YjiH family protein n=1 Tax=Salinisphaera orenii TaxID=856731 RepID=UPI000DBE1CBC|nr:YjiH family protein [Salifodinibacter halophilus]NNC25732.1 YjiH family protein [Salifodinibacter halophilus]
MGEQDRLNTVGHAPFKALVGSLIGVCLFFIPFPTASGDTQIPLVSLIDGIKHMLGDGLQYTTVGVVMLLCVTWLASQFTAHTRLKEYHHKDGYITGGIFILAAIFATLLVLHIGPDWLLDKDVGGMALKLGSSVLLTVSVAGFLVVFLMAFGFPEFIGTLMEPSMRVLYRVPGRAAVDAVASFVASPAVGVFITNQFYKDGQYTQREAATIATSFSVVSIGFFALLCSIGGILEYLPHMIVTSFIIIFLTAIVTSRIPPLSRKRDIYIDNREDAANTTQEHASQHILVRACQAASRRAAATGLATFKKALWDAITFAQKIVAYVIAIATLSLVVATYTPVFNYLGAAFEYPLAVLQLPDAGAIAPTILISIAEIALPAIIISGTQADPMSIFFVCTLSTVQLIFFTESANAILEADIPLSVWELVLIFIIRTLIALPLVAIAAHLIF